MATEVENGTKADTVDNTAKTASPWTKLEEEENLGPVVKLAEPMPSWTRSRTYALAVKEREAKRAKAERELKRKREAEQMNRRLDYEIAARQQSKTNQQGVDTEEQERLEARKMMNERLESIVPHAFEEVWDVNI